VIEHGDCRVSQLSGQYDRSLALALARCHNLDCQGDLFTGTLRRRMEAFCVPPTAFKRGESTIGGTLNTQAWSYLVRPDLPIVDSWGFTTTFSCVLPQVGHVAAELIVTAAGCIPVVQAAAETLATDAQLGAFTERAVADLWLNV
jgi:hypothetical protein